MNRVRARWTCAYTERLADHIPVGVEKGIACGCCGQIRDGCSSWTAAASNSPRSSDDHPGVGVDHRTEPLPPVLDAGGKRFEHLHRPVQIGPRDVVARQRGQCREQFLVTQIGPGRAAGSARNLPRRRHSGSPRLRRQRRPRSRRSAISKRSRSGPRSDVVELGEGPGQVLAGLGEGTAKQRSCRRALIGGCRLVEPLGALVVAGDQAPVRLAGTDQCVGHLGVQTPPHGRGRQFGGHLPQATRGETASRRVPTARAPARPRVRR